MEREHSHNRFDHSNPYPGALSDRLCVMFEGAITFETTPAQSSAAEVGRFMAGHAHT